MPKIHQWAALELWDYRKLFPLQQTRLRKPRLRPVDSVEISADHSRLGTSNTGFLSAHFVRTRPYATGRPRKSRVDPRVLLRSSCRRQRLRILSHLYPTDENSFASLRVRANFRC